MSIFAETIAKAISDYRYLLRRHLDQADRVGKLAELKLNDRSIFENDMRMYEVAQLIVKDIEDNINIPEQSYYSYSGIAKFCEYLKEYLANYHVENGHLIHRAQKASRAMIDAVQMITLAEEFTSELLEKLLNYNREVCAFGSLDQKELYKLNLERQLPRDPVFFSRIVDDFDSLILAARQRRRVRVVRTTVSQEEDDDGRRVGGGPN